MRVLVLSLHFAPETVSNAVVATELVEELVAHGHEVTVVAALPYHRGHRIEAGYRGRIWQVDHHGSARVFRTWLLLRGSKCDVGGRLLAYATFNLTSTAIGAVTGPHDVVITPSPPLTIGISGWLLARLWGARFIYNVQDIYPDAAVKLGLLRGRRTVQFFSALERFVYARADAVTVLSDDFRANLLAKGVPDRKVVVIPNGVDADFIQPLPRDNAFARQHGLRGSCVALYAGNVGLAQGMETLVDAAEHSTVPGLQVVIVGSGAAAQDTRERANGHGRVRFLPFEPRERVPELYASADLGVVLLRAGMGDTSVPSKLYTIMAAGKPVVASVDPGSATWRLVEEVGCGVCVPPGNPEALARAMDALWADEPRRRCLAERGRRYVEQHHDRHRVGDRYDALLRELRREMFTR
jgi:colanic acid biosynthesis glycosyl transferase WcaI